MLGFAMLTPTYGLTIGSLNHEANNNTNQRAPETEYPEPQEAEDRRYRDNEKSENRADNCEDS